MNTLSQKHSAMNRENFDFVSSRIANRDCFNTLHRQVLKEFSVELSKLHVASRDFQAEALNTLVTQVSLHLSKQTDLKVQFGDWMREPSFVNALSLNMVKMGTKKRWGDFDYATHPMLMAYNLNKSGASVQTGILAVLHDLFEEQPQLNALFEEDFIAQKVSINKIGEKLKALIEPWDPYKQDEALVAAAREEVFIPNRFQESYDRSIWYTLVYARFYQQFKSSDVSVLAVEITDRMEDVMDCEYLLQNPKYSLEEKRNRFVEKYAKCLWTCQKIAKNHPEDQVIQKLFKAFEALLNYQINQRTELQGFKIDFKKDILPKMEQFEAVEKWLSARPE